MMNAWVANMLTFFQNLLDSCISLAKVLLISRFSLSKFHKNRETASILGNGPSLNQSLEESGQFIKSTDIYCVNNFALSQVYTVVQPQNYVMLDPAYFLYSPANAARKDVEQNIKAILEHTSWQMRLFVPSGFRDSFIVKEILKNKPNIRVCFFNYTIVRGFEWFRHWFFRNNLGMPQCQNILAACTYLAVLQGYKEIYLWGADHSWHEEIRISENNELEMRQLHFYDNQSQIKHEKVIDVRNNSRPKLHAQFLSLHKAFYAYEILQKFAISKGVKILNASKKSYIDAFDRIIVRDFEN